MNTTITDSIELGKMQSVSHGHMQYKVQLQTDKGDTVIANYGSIIDKYMPVLNKYIYEWTMPYEEYTKYKYQPKRLSLELYGTIELWSALLSINHVYSISGFDLQTIRIFDPAEIMSVIEEILIKEEDYLTGMDSFLSK